VRVSVEDLDRENGPKGTIKQQIQSRRQGTSNKCRIPQNNNVPIPQVHSPTDLSTHGGMQGLKTSVEYSIPNEIPTEEGQGEDLRRQSNPPSASPAQSLESRVKSPNRTIVQTVYEACD